MTGTVKPNIYIGLIVFVVVLALLVVAAAPMQAAWGMWGLALTEVMLLISAIVPALILKWDLREIFRFSRPSVRQIFGVLVLWLGAYIAVLAITMITAYLFPEGMGAVSNELLDFFSSVPFPLTLLIMAVLPAVCEEALHRGLILHTFAGNNKWVTIIAMGLIFGIFHLDPYRFLATAVLGVILTFIMIETGNILLPVLFHFVNNSMTSLSTLINEPGQALIRPPLSTVGIFLILSSAVPFLFIAGSKLLKAGAESRSNSAGRRVIYAAIASAIILAAAGLGLASAPITQEPLFETSFSGGVNRNTQPHNLEFTVLKGGSYSIDLNIQGDRVVTAMVITNSRREQVFDVTAETLTLNGSIDLKAGVYTITLTHENDSEDFLTVSVDIIIRE